MAFSWETSLGSTLLATVNRSVHKFKLNLDGWVLTIDKNETGPQPHPMPGLGSRDFNLGFELNY
jgi:hypothetical protein